MKPLLAVLLVTTALPGAAFAQSSPSGPSADRIETLRGRLTAFIDSLHAAGAEEVFTLGRGGNAPQDPIEKMDRIFDRTYRNPEADRISKAARDWGKLIRWEFRDLGDPIITRIEIHKGTHEAVIYHKDSPLLTTEIAVGNPTIGKATPEGSYAVLYVDWRPISRWKRGNVPYGHEYNPYGSRQIPFYKDWTMHGNNDPNALGKDISKGCVRFNNSEIMVIAELVRASATKVVVKP